MKLLKSTDPIIRRIFLDTLFVAIIVELTNALSIVVDGAVIGTCLSEDALAAHNLARIYFYVTAVISGLLATGLKVACSKSFGRGDVHEANRIFSVTSVFAFAVTFIVMILVYVFLDPFLWIIGAGSPGSVLYAPARDYILGLLPASLPIVGIALLTPVLQLDGGKRRIQAVIILLSLLLISFNILNVTVFYGGMLGMGLATAAANWIAFLVMLVHFFKKSSLFHFSLRELSLPHLRPVIKLGAPKTVQRLMNTLRPLLINQWVLYVGGSVVLSALSVQNNLLRLIMLISFSVNSAIMMISAVLFADKDRSAMSEIMRLSLRTIAISSAVIVVFGCAFSPLLVRMFIPEAGEAQDMAVVALCLFLIGLPFLSFNELYIGFLQGTERLSEAHVLLFCNLLIFPLLSAYVGGILFDVYGIFASYAVSHIIVTLTIAVMIRIKLGRFPRSVEDIMQLPKEFDSDKGHSIEFHLRSMDEAVGISRSIFGFCDEAGIDKKRAFRLSLCIEELSTEIITHGFADGKAHNLHIRIYLEGDDLIMRVRDDCSYFDAKKKLETEKNSDIMSYVGIKMVMSMAKEVNYINTLNTNNLTVIL